MRQNLAIMAATPSTMLALRTPAPDFSLPEAVTGRLFSLADFSQDRALLVMFICNHCPFVVHVRDELTRLAADVSSRGVGVVAINANDVEGYPQDGPFEMKKLVGKLGWKFPYLFDATQETAKAYRAACTPDYFLFDAARELAYRGQLDPSRPGNGVPVTGKDLRAAIHAVLSGEPVSPEQKPSIGCNIKWKASEAPGYLR